MLFYVIIKTSAVFLPLVKKRIFVLHPTIRDIAITILFRMQIIKPVPL